MNQKQRMKKIERNKLKRKRRKKLVSKHGDEWAFNRYYQKHLKKRKHA